MNNEENNLNEPTDQLGKRKRKKPQPIASVKSPLETKIKELNKRGFDHNRIAAMLMCQKSLVEQVLK